jgi:hypothetical protein
MLFSVTVGPSNKSRRDPTLDAFDASFATLITVDSTGFFPCPGCISAARCAVIAAGSATAGIDAGITNAFVAPPPEADPPAPPPPPAAPNELPIQGPMTAPTTPAANATHIFI